jgi:hypothetical protein
MNKEWIRKTYVLGVTLLILIQASLLSLEVGGR